MSYQEKKALLNLLTYFTVIGSYGWYVYTHYWNPTMNTDELLLFWSKFLLISIPVQIVLHILIHILMGIFRGVANGGKIVEDKEDEFDKIIDLKSNRNSSVIFAISLIISMSFLALGHGVSTFFIVLIIGGMAGELGDALSRVYYYRMGV